MAVDLYFNVAFTIETGKFEIDSNIKPEHQAEIVSNFLRNQMGAGKDKSTPNKLDVYHIKLELDLSDDSFGSLHDCGNKGLRDGILLEVLGKLEMDRDA